MTEMSPNRYYYKAFGLNILSEFEIPELYSFEFSEPHVEIRYDSVPDKLSDSEKKGVRFQLNRNEFLLTIDDIAKYYVARGNKITIEKQDGATSQEVRLFLLSSVFSALLYLRGSVSLHASTIKKDNKCFILCGNSGAGKSTLTREFIDQGYQLLSDDISVLTENIDKIHVQPSFPFIKLWKYSLEHLNLPEAEGKKLRNKLEKYGFRLQDEYFSESLEVEKVFILMPHNKPEYTSEVLKGIDKFNALKNHTYRYRFVLDNLRPVHFECMNKLANQAETIRIKRPQAPINTEDLRKQIEAFL